MLNQSVLALASLATYGRELFLQPSVLALGSVTPTFPRAASTNQEEEPQANSAETAPATSADDEDQLPELPIGGFGPGDAGLYDEETNQGSADATLDSSPASPAAKPEDWIAEDEVSLPVFGRLRAGEIGLPAFTIAIGLVDGFNPCAMWVLLFLLSILVNLKDRGRILAVAGTFVVISGVAYYAFMAAWLNVFLLVGLVRPIQIMLGLLAIAVGSIHVKDFFAFKRGVSLSIPESAKPGIYRRVRGIVNAENIWGAIIGAIVLAVLVNIVELLCTAGLPALYTEVLTMQQLPSWQNYAYLALYIVAYMLDDSLMVAAVVITLGKRKMQETEGRWLKLISGLVILILGVVMIFRPEWLH